MTTGSGGHWFRGLPLFRRNCSVDRPVALASGLRGPSFFIRRSSFTAHARRAGGGSGALKQSALTSGLDIPIAYAGMFNAAAARALLRPNF
eukprot:scaffold76019_cov66-Phaeocystis_antarctica.AAC.12